MHNYSVTKRCLTIFFGFFLLLMWGCDKQPEVKEKSKTVVSKKVVMADKGAPAQTPPAKTPGATPSDGMKPGAADAGAQQKAPAAVVIDQKAGDMAYVYDPTGKLDPFAPIFREQTGAGEAEPADERRPRRAPLTPLEQISLSQLKLVAVMLAPSGNKALVEEVSGKGYIIQEGTYIGMNSGRVVDIMIDKVVVEEEVEDILGNFTLRKTEMKLQKTPGE